MKFLVGTRKGLFRVERRRDGWHVADPEFLGVPILNAAVDPRDGAVWVCAGHGHWGPKLYVSRDGGAGFEERTCPAFPDGFEIDAVTEFGHRHEQAVVKRLYTIRPIGEPGRFLIGCDPGALFETRDGGETWSINEALWTLRNEHNWFEGGGGVMLHTILPDPRDENSLRIAVSCGGVYETTDGGASWRPRNRGVRADFLPEPFPEFGQDTHMLCQGRADPDVLWQQNHCGNFRSTDGGRTWTDVTAGLPSSIGFCLALDPMDDGVAWTVPMQSDECRIAPGAALVCCRSDDGGASWRELRDGLPQRHCYDIVFRHALAATGTLVTFGTTCGSLFASEDRGNRWKALETSLPPIHSIALDPT